MMRADELLHPTPSGLYCPVGDFYIDPIRPVKRALITHGHADHARAGHEAVLATRATLDIMAVRYGENFTSHAQTASFHELLTLNGVDISFHPAGHVLGSAQISVAHKGTKIVASGDYKRRRDSTTEAFECIDCDIFITEATFGLPVFRHPCDHREISKLLTSLRQFPERAHLVGAYALGKAQRVIKLVREQGYNAPIYIHGSMKKLCDLYEAYGVDLGPLLPATIDHGKKGDFAGSIIIAPPSAFANKWARRFPDPLIAFASGWMNIRQRAKQRGVELPLILSDHADWDELTGTIAEIHPAEVWVTHGREEALVRWCEINKITAKPLYMVGYEEDGE